MTWNLKGQAEPQMRLKILLPVLLFFQKSYHPAGTDFHGLNVSPCKDLIAYLPPTAPAPLQAMLPAVLRFCLFLEQSFYILFPIAGELLSSGAFQSLNLCGYRPI